MVKNPLGPKARTDIMAHFRCVLQVVLMLALLNCSPKPKMPMPKPQPDPWSVTCLDPKAPGSALVWNAFVGGRINRLGLAAVDDEGAPQQFWLPGYEKGGEERIRPVDQWFPTKLMLNGKEVKVGDVNNYEQRVDFHELKLITKYSVPRCGVHLEFVHPFTRADHAFAGATCTIKADKIVKVQFLRREVHQPPGQEAFEVKKGATVRHELNATKWIMGDQWGTDDSLEAFWTTDIEIDGPVEDQQFIRSALFYLRTGMSLNPFVELEDLPKVSPMMMSSLIYHGHVFWDADVWVFPALALLDPTAAKIIPEYRLAMLPQARKNALGNKDNPEIPWGDKKFLPQAAQFPWESSVSGKETVLVESRKQHHITGTVAFSVQLAADLGLVPQSQADELGKAAANFWMARSKVRADGTREVLHTMSPDEHHIGDNDLYTNILAEWCIRRYLKQDVTFYRPKDNVSFLTYDADKLKGYKQAAALLAVWPLEDPACLAQAGKMFDRFKDKVIKNGPAMTDCIHAIVAARLGRGEEAYHYWLDSWKPFTKDPLLLFSEKRTQDRTYFTTGAAGALNSVIYGFCGIEIDPVPVPGALKTLRLQSGQVVSIKPALPNEWGSVTIKGLTFDGKRYDLTVKKGSVDLVPHASAPR